jgi:poly-gamma-glutamate system protein
LLDEKVAAATLMGRAIGIIKEERVRRGIEIDPETDPNATGLIGASYTDITTTLGSIGAKRTSTNPNFAGAIVQMMSEAGVKPGDGVAISFSASFPALNIAVLSAAEVLKVRPAIISSLGASTYGANDPRLTWIDMERILWKHGIFPHVSHAVSLGGIVETQGGLEGQGVTLALEAVSRNEIPYLEENGMRTLQRDIERRMAIYDRILDGKTPALFINSGGPLTSLGNIPEVQALSTGRLSKVPSTKDPQRGIIFRMNEQGVPVIHLLNIKSIARRYGLPIDPFPLPPVPSGGVMKPSRHSVPLAVSALILLCVFIASLRVQGVTGSRGQGKRVPGQE